MPYQLVVIKGRSASAVLRVPAESLTLVGRQQGCQIRIVSSLVSRKHCELAERGGRLIVRDLGSSNGTYVNGVKITGPQALDPGSALVIGSVVFRVESVAAPGSAEPTVMAGSPGDTAVPAMALPADEIDFEIEAEPEGGSGVQTAQAPVPTALAEAAEVEELGEDAVADFLMGLDDDDRGKR